MLSDAAALDAAVAATVAAIVAAAAKARLAARPLCLQGHHPHLEVPLLSCGPPRSSLSALPVTRRLRRLVRRPWPWLGLTLLASLTDDVMASPGCGEQGPTSAPPSDLHEHERDGSEDHRHQDHRRQDRRQQDHHQHLEQNVADGRNLGRDARRSRAPRAVARHLRDEAAGAVQLVIVDGDVVVAGVRRLGRAYVDGAQHLSDMVV